MHKFALMAAAASMVAHEHNLFWEFHDLLFKNYKELNREKIIALGNELGISSSELEKSFTNEYILLKIQKDIMDAKQAGVRGVPKVFINGMALKERTLKAFQIEIDKALTKQAK